MRMGDGGFSKSSLADTCICPVAAVLVGRSLSLDSMPTLRWRFGGRSCNRKLFHLLGVQKTCNNTLNLKSGFEV